jgi:UDP-N-acetylglucosamine:LPS N-acetylglucosamine transferase
MKKRILIPYFLAGSGHLVSATAIHHFLCSKRPDWDIRLFEPAEELRIDLLNGLYKNSWKFVLKRPLISGPLFFLSEHLLSFLTIAVSRYVTRKAAPAMSQFLADYKPDLIVTTHWGCGHLASEAMSTGAPKVPLLVVRNDLGGAYKLQKVECDLTIVMAKEARDAFMRLGTPADRLMLANPLVRPQFSRDHTESADTSADDPFRILLSSGGEGLGNISKTARIMLREAARCNREIEIDILAGRNTALKDTLENTLKDPQVTIHGYRDDVHLLMQESDIVVGKCGANYTMETAMIGKPFLITQVGAPSERPNMRYVLERGFGWYAGDFVSLRRTLNRILSDPEEMRSCLANLATLPRKNGAEEVADRVIAEVMKSDEVPERDPERGPARVSDRPGV